MRVRSNYFGLILFFQAFASPSFSRDNAIDSLRQLLNGKEDTVQVNLLEALSHAYAIKADPEAYRAGNKSLELARRLNFRYGQIRAYMSLGYYYEQISEYEKAGEMYDKALALCDPRQDKKILSRLWLYKGIVYSYHSDAEKSIEATLRALQINEQLNDLKGIATCYISLGNTYLDFNDQDKALEYYQKGLEIEQKINYEDGISSCLANIGLTWSKKGNYRLSREYHQKSLEMELRRGYTVGVAQTYSNIGVTYYYEKNFVKAIEYFLKSYQLHKEINNKAGISNALLNLGSAYEETGYHSKAIEYTRQSIEYALEVKEYRKAMVGYESLSDLYVKSGNYKDALEAYRKRSEVNDSLFSREKMNQVTRMQTVYETDKKEKENQLLKKDQLLKDSEIKQQKVVQFFLLGIVLLAAALGMVLFRANRSKQRANEALSRLNVEITMQNEEIEKQKTVIERQKEIVEEKNKDITDSIRYAQRIQEAILPAVEKTDLLLQDYFVLYRPKDIVSGDFYWVEQWGEPVLFAAVDCTGHGVPGAFMSIVGHDLLDEIVNVQGINKPPLILNALSKGVAKMFSQKSRGEIKDGMDIALCALNRAKMMLEYAGAFNPLWMVRKNEMVEIRADKQPIGLINSAEPYRYTGHEIPLQPGDVIYIFTDGYADQFGGPKGKKFKYKQLAELLLTNHHLPMEQQKKILEEAFERWRSWPGNDGKIQAFEQVDDVCIIGVRV